MPILDDTQFQANTWYSGTITVDDINGITVEVEQQNDPSVSGSYQDSNNLLTAGQNWVFYGGIFSDNLFIDNYQKQTVTLPPPDDWTFFASSNGAYLPESASQIQLTGTESNWDAFAWRSSGYAVTDGDQATFDFKVDVKDNKAFVGLTSDPVNLERIVLLDADGVLYLQIFRQAASPTHVTFPILSAAEFDADEWYSVTITVDDINGTLFEIEKRDDPSVSGSYQDTTGLLSTGRSWVVIGSTYQGNLFIDNYVDLAGP